MIFINFYKLTLHSPYIKHAQLPLSSNSADAVILSTVLCCVPQVKMQKEIINELNRVINKNGVIYFCDFLISDSFDFERKYQQGLSLFNEWGVYKTSENAIVRHFTEKHIEELMVNFQRLWYHKQNFFTMNGNTVNTFHGIYKAK